MKKVILNTILILLFIPFMSCSDNDDDKEKETIKEPTKEELLAKIYGQSGPYTLTTYIMGEEAPLLTDEQLKASFYTTPEGKLCFYDGSLDNDGLEFWYIIEPDSVSQEGDVISVKSKTRTKVNAYVQQGPQSQDTYLDEADIIFNTKTKRYVARMTIESQQVAFIWEYIGVLDTSKNPIKLGDFQKSKAYTVSSNVNSRSLKLGGDNSFTGIKNVYVELSGNTSLAKFAVRLFQPRGNYQVKFTKKDGAKTQVEFCDINGNVIVSRKGGTGFHGGSMPMRLYFMNVQFSLSDNSIVDANDGKNHIKTVPCDDCGSVSLPGWLMNVINPNGMESFNGQVMDTPQTSGKFNIKVKLNLPLDFTADITEKQ